MSDYFTILPGQQRNGMGLLAIAAAAPAAGPAAPIVAAVGIVGSVIGGIKKLFGGGVDDQATSYRPPGDSASRSVVVKGQKIAFDMSNLAEAQRRGNRLDDIYSYYSVFERDNLSGASSAAARVVQDAASKYTFGNLRDAAITLLDLAGVRKIVTPVQQPVSQPPAQAQSFTQTSQTASEKPTVLPPVTDIFFDILDYLKGQKAPPIPDFRPIPMDQAPPPPAPAGQNPAQTQAQNQAQAAAQKALIAAAQKAAAALLKARQGVASNAAAQGCDPATQFYDPARNACVTLVSCPEGQYFEPSLQRCAIPPDSGEDLGDFFDSLGTIGGIPVWLLILVGLVVVSTRSDGGRTVSFRRRS